MARYKVCGREQVRDTSLDVYTKIGDWEQDDEVSFTLSNGDYITIHFEWRQDGEIWWDVDSGNYTVVFLENVDGEVWEAYSSFYDLSWMHIDNRSIMEMRIYQLPEYMAYEAGFSEEAIAAAGTKVGHLVNGGSGALPSGSWGEIYKFEPGYRPARYRVDRDFKAMGA